MRDRFIGAGFAFLILIPFGAWLLHGIDQIYKKQYAAAYKYADEWRQLAEWSMGLKTELTEVERRQIADRLNQLAEDKARTPQEHERLQKQIDRLLQRPEKPQMD